MPARKPAKTIGKRKSVPVNRLKAVFPDVAKTLAEAPDKEIPLVQDGEIVAYVVSAARLAQLKAPVALATRPAPERAERDVKIVSDIKEGLRRIKQEIAEGVASEWDDLNRR